MSTAGVHIPVPSPSSRPLVRDRVSSKSWFIFSWMDERSLNGSHQRTIAMSRLLSPGAGSRAGPSVFAWGSLFLPRVLVFRVHHVALRPLPLPGLSAGLATRGGGGLAVHVLREGVRLLDQLLRRPLQRRLVLRLQGLLRLRERGLHLRHGVRRDLLP